jgi:phosphatidylserine/phosphatidylglycerophosphate/cardiolipin synthase-like enzyme
MTLLIKVKLRIVLSVLVISLMGVMHAQNLIVDAIEEQFITLQLNSGANISNIRDVRQGINIDLKHMELLDDRYRRLNGLEAGKIYQLYLTDGSQHFIATKSMSSGEMKVYFNNEVDESFSDGSVNNGTTIGVLERDLINLINRANISIDFCSYNTSRISIVNALRDAYARGVQVRVIADDETSNYGWEDNPPFPVVKGNQGDDLMHNKFMIIDADEMDDSWVITGSMNYTENQMESDPNHLIWIQDKSLAQAYTLEFEEMWGSNGPQPNISAGKWGRDKNDNTPHRFNINGTMVELYFSPSDNTALHIGEALKTGDYEINCGLLLFTYYDLRDILIDEHRDGTKVRLIIEDTGTSSGIINDLEAEGIPVIDHPPSQQFHHKYAIVDEGRNSDAIVITGSHNWSYSADNYNDENTLIIYSQSIANIFKQEFQRWWGAFSTSTDEVENPKNYRIYPNPSHDRILISGPTLINTVSLIDMTGKEVLNKKIKAYNWSIDLRNLNKGLYLLKINDHMVEKIIKI